MASRSPRSPSRFTKNQLEYLRANYQPLQDRERLPCLAQLLYILAIYIIIWLLLGVFFPVLVEVFVGRTWLWQIKTSWGLAWLLVLLLAWARGQVLEDMWREMGNRWERQKRDRVSSVI